MPIQPDSNQRSDEFIPVNQILHAKPQLGPIPGEHVIAWIAIAIVVYIICKGILSLSWIATGLVGVWGIATWWLLNGDESWRYLTKFCRVPRWALGNLQYSKLLDQPSEEESSKKIQSRKKPRKRESPATKPSAKRRRR